MKPKVMIGTITFDNKGYVLERFILRVKELTYPYTKFVIIDTSNGKNYYNRICKLVKDIPNVVVINDPKYEDTRENCSKARNHLVKIFLESDCEYMFHLEQDVIPRKDIIEELIQWKKLVIGGWYYINQGKSYKRACVFDGFVPIIFKNGIKMQMKPMSYDKMAERRLMKCYLGSLGIILVHRDIFEKHKIRFWWALELSWHDDTGFFHDLDIRGIDFFIDTDCLVPHFQSNWAVENFKKLKLEIMNSGKGLKGRDN